MSLVSKWSIAICCGWIGVASIDGAAPGFLEGHIKFISIKQVELADQKPSKTTVENYADYPLTILSSDGKKEIARITADANGNYRTPLSPGAYVLDAEGHARGHGLMRVKPQLFTIVSNQTVRVDIEIDTGVR